MAAYQSACVIGAHGYSTFRIAICHILPALFAIGIGALAIMAFTDRHSIAVTAVKIVPPVVSPGGTAYAVFNLTDYSHGRCNDGIVRRWLTDSRGIIFTLTDVTVVQVVIPPDGPSQAAHTLPVRVNFPVPVGMSDGIATYHALAERWCTPIQRLWPIVGHYESRFEVSRERGVMAPEPEGLN